MRVLSTFLALALALAPLSVAAQVSDDLATVERLYDEGKALYETADYDGAIAKWTEAYSKVGEGPESAEIRSTLIYNLASAHEAAFEIDADTTHLTKAKVLLERFDVAIPEIYEAEAAQTERARVRERIAGLEAKLADARGEASEPEPEPTPATEASPGPESVPEPTPEAGPPPGNDTDRGHAGRPLLIAGSVTLAVGVGGLGAGVFGLIESDKANDFDEEALGISEDALATREEQILRGQRMNVLSYAGLIAGGVLVVTGATLIGLSVRAKKRQVAALPAVGPTHAGLSVGGRF